VSRPVRHNPKVTAIAGVILAKGSEDNGVTVQEIMDETGFTKTTVHRIVTSSPGFYQCKGAHWPHKYYFNAQGVTFDTETEKPQTQSGGNSKREYKETVHTADSRLVTNKLFDTEVITNDTGKALSAIAEILNNITEFKAGDAKLDPMAVGKAKTAIKEAQYTLETYYQFLSRFANIDTSDPIWWENV
jgi:hypothetical protein